MVGWLHNNEINDDDDDDDDDAESLAYCVDLLIYYCSDEDVIHVNNIAH